MKAFWEGKCPRCAKGDVFKYPVLNLFHFMKMHEACPVCNATYQPEPGFYFGAMFISYAFTVVLMVVNWLVLYLFFKPTTNTYMYSFLISVLIFSPFSFRYSRLIWLYWFGGHKHQS